MAADSLFTQVIAESTLSPIFAKNALLRALTRAGISDAEKLTKEQLKKALPEVLKTLQSFLGDDAGGALQKIEALTR